MYIQQLYTNCLSHAAYYIESQEKAIIIDPLADVQSYLELAKERNTTITHILETHFHADFVSGHLQLSELTGAPIVFGSKAKPNYKAQFVEDGEIIQVGDLTIQALHTPGHTLESVTYLLKDEDGNDYAIFTGDTLFLGDVGRPDLSSGNLSSKELASYLYDSLQTKIMPLADSVIVYPGHGAGSACGKKLSDATSSTLGEQKQTNYALRAPDKATFIKEVTDGMKQPPAYFFSVAKENQQGPTSFTLDIPELSEEELLTAQEKGALIIDSRSKETFVQGFIPGAINIGLSGRFAPWVGAIIPPNSSLIIFSSPDELEETIIRLARVGYTDIKGVYTKGIEHWKKHHSIEHLPVVSPSSPSGTLIDVRTEEEFSVQHPKNATNIPIDHIRDQQTALEQEAITLVCASGYRAVIAASLLKQQGQNHVAVAFS